MGSVELAVVGPIPRGTHFGFIAPPPLLGAASGAARALRLPGAPRHIVAQVGGKA
jgi:hypothetical protein